MGISWERAVSRRVQEVERAAEWVPTSRDFKWAKRGGRGGEAAPERETKTLDMSPSFLVEVVVEAWRWEWVLRKMVGSEMRRVYIVLRSLDIVGKGRYHK